MSCIQTRGLAYGQISYRDLDIEEGKATFISGPSGCGKSTLLRLFNKTLAPTAGSVLYQGQDMIKARGQVEYRCLARAVGADEAHKGVVFHGDGKIR